MGVPEAVLASLLPLSPLGEERRDTPLCFQLGPPWKTSLCGAISVLEVDQCKLAVLIIHPLPGGEVEAGGSEIPSHR